MVVITGDLRRGVIRGGAGQAGERVSNGIGATIDARGAFDLGGRGRGAPDKVFRERAEGWRRHGRNWREA
jgi:hypothetical protein